MEEMGARCISFPLTGLQLGLLLAAFDWAARFVFPLPVVDAAWSS